jgi:hypothetical protein
MFVYGEKGRSAPYAVKVLTQMHASKLLISKTKNTSVSLLISNIVFLDSTAQ